MWTSDDDARLRELWASGLSTALIGEAMKRTKNAVVGRAHRMDLPARGSPLSRPGRQSAFTPEVQARALALRAQGFSNLQIAKQLGLGEETVRHRLRVLCPPMPGAPRQVNRVIFHKRPIALPKPAPVAWAPPLVRVSTGRGCRWPMWGDADRPTHVYCDAPVIFRADGVPSSYCSECAARAFNGAPVIRAPHARRLGYA